MNILSIPYITGGLSHFIPLYVLQKRYLMNNAGWSNYFLVNNNIQNFLNIQGINSAPLDYIFEEKFLLSNSYSEIKDCILRMEREAYDTVKPALIIEDNAFFSPLIAEKNNIPRISIQRTGFFRSTDDRFRNKKHVHSLEKGSNTISSFSFSNSRTLATKKDYKSDLYLLQQYINPKVKIIPGIPTIECLPENVENSESYFYSGPLLVLDKPSKDLSNRLSRFLEINKDKPVVFVTTGTVDRTPVEKYIEYFVEKNYAVITTSDYQIKEEHREAVFYNKLIPLNHICKIADLVVHQCGSGIYHYPIMHRVPSLTIGTLCYDREDIAQRLQELGVSGHIPHPDDNPEYWNVFIELVHRFENNDLVNFDMLEKLGTEIDETMSNFQMDKVVNYALS